MDQTTAEIFGNYDEKEGLAGRNRKIIPIYVITSLQLYASLFSRL